MTLPARLVPEIPFPDYSYVPGRFPHPFSHPAGHRFGRNLTEEADFDPSTMERSVRYRLGFDLFNYGFYWEAHESWETLWHLAGRTTPAGRFLKAFIQWAVVGVKAKEGRPDGMITHARRAVELFESLGEMESFGGFHLHELVRTSQDWTHAIQATHELPEGFIWNLPR